MPGVKILKAEYELFPSASLGGRALLRPRVGALLQVQWKDGVGYADLHPWPELGDLPLAKQLECLVEGGRTPLLGRSLLMAREDSRARSRGVNLFTGLKVPKSHFLVTDFSILTEPLLEQALAHGFTRIKIKITGDLKVQAQRLKKLGAVLGPQKTAFWRLDFNASMSAQEAFSFLQELGSESKRIDFIEDPLPWDEVDWAELKIRFGVPLAADREKPPGMILEECADFRVIKPAVETPENIPDDLPRVYTSYLDHPLGQAAAAWEAARSETTQICGLLSQGAYQNHAFAEALAPHGPSFIAPEGTGLGFDSLLRSLDWKPLV